MTAWILEIGLWISAILLLLTKGLDVASTWAAIRHAAQETNPFARSLMRKFGVRNGLWLAAFAAFAIIIAVLIAIPSMPVEAKPFAIIGMLVVSWIQGAVAMTNFTGVTNPVTRGVAIAHLATTRLLNNLRRRFSGWNP